MERSISSEHDILEDTLHELNKDAPTELVTTLIETLKNIKYKHPHLVSKITSCMPKLANRPTLIEVLAIVYIINGGVLLKYDMDGDIEEPNDGDDSKYKRNDSSDIDLNDMLKELESEFSK